MIKIINLSIKYRKNDVWVINKLSLDIDNNQIAALVGNNGCGKTTLLCAVGGLIPSHIKANIEGDILIENINIKDYRRLDFVKKVGLISGNSKTNLIFSSVEDELAFSLENLNIEKELIKNKVHSLAKEFNITHLLERKCDTLSAGEQALVNILAIVILGCKIILADEVFKNVDKLNAKIIWEAFEKIKNKGGLVLLAEHSEEIKNKCDSIIDFEAL